MSDIGSIALIVSEIARVTTSQRLFIGWGHNPSLWIVPRDLSCPDHYLKYRWECFLSDNRDRDWGYNTIAPFESIARGPRQGPQGPKSRLFVLVNWRYTVHSIQNPGEAIRASLWTGFFKVVGARGVQLRWSLWTFYRRAMKRVDFLWYAETRFAEWEIKGLHCDAWRVLLRFNAANDTQRREKNESQVFCCDVHFTWRCSRSCAKLQSENCGKYSWHSRTTSL